MARPYILERDDFIKPRKKNNRPMKKYLIKKFCQSLLRILVALTIILGIPVLGYWLWQPGCNDEMPNFANNAIWLGHGWLGDDNWFKINGRNKEDFRAPIQISALMQNLSTNKIATVYPHLCPAKFNGEIAAYDSTQIEQFLDIAAQYNIKVIPWIGGVFEESARLSDVKWRENFVFSVRQLLQKHPRLAGVQVNIEPMPSGNENFLELLVELKKVTKDKTLSVAAYPPPTKWHQFPSVHWELPYLTRVAKNCDQLTIMMYDTAIPFEKFYIKLMTDWTSQLIKSVAGKSELLLGIPAYEDAGAGYHHPRVENINSALRGISAAEFLYKVNGIAIYCEWEMTEAKWQSWRNFIR